MAIPGGGTFICRIRTRTWWCPDPSASPHVWMDFSAPFQAPFHLSLLLHDSHSTQKASREEELGQGLGCIFR